VTARLALHLQDAHPIRDGMRYAQHAEAAGFEAVWQAESRLVREATVPLAAFGAVTERIGLGSGVVSMWVRNPAFLAATFSTLDDLAPGRVTLGIGAWWDPLAAKVGVRRDKPLRAMREIVTVVRALLANESVTFEGEFVHLDGVELDYVHQERRPKHVPIVIGATGLQMMRLAGEIGDGALLNYLVSPAYNEGALAALAEGAARAGRSLDDIDRPQLVVCSMDDDRDAALDAGRLLGAGIGIAAVSGIELIMSSARPERADSASGVNETLVEASGALGIAVRGSVLVETDSYAWPLPVVAVVAPVTAIGIAWAFTLSRASRRLRAAPTP
jgi:5,10-methylenetetrahydromethanopterin reductase